MHWLHAHTASSLDNAELSMVLKFSCPIKPYLSDNERVPSEVPEHEADLP